MNITYILTFSLYFLALLLTIYFSYHKQKSEADFVIGNRSLNFYLTALSAHASDMSSWLFIAYPAMIFTSGIFGAWAAIGLTLFMFLNWHFVAPKIRTITEKLQALTLNSYFEKKFADQSGMIRLISTTMTLLFYTIYISSGLVALGLLSESLFQMNYHTGITIGLGLVVLYVFLGGYSTVAWIDLMQGMFLLGVILFIPGYFLYTNGGLSPLLNAISNTTLSHSLIPDFSWNTLLQIIIISLGWGLGYFGQPHITTKFMGIKNVDEMSKSKYLGISWQILTLGSSTLIGIIGISMYYNTNIDPESLTISLVKSTFSPIFIALVLCAIVAATTNVIAAQILVVASSLSEDFYKKWISPHASSKHLLAISRLSVLLTALLAYIIAFFKVSTIYQLVLVAWSGLGASFGPLLLFSLYSSKITKQGALFGILVGGVTVAVTSLFKGSHILWDFPIIPGFILSTLAIFFISFITSKTSIKRTSHE